MLLKRLIALAAAAWLAIVPALADQSSLSAPTTGTLPGLTMVNDYNSAINAVNTCNSGASAPSNQLSGGPSAGNCWYNTSTGAVQYYDGASWLTVGYIDATNHIWTPVLGGGAATTVASATTTNLCGSSGAAPVQPYLTISGTTTITGFGSNCQVGQVKILTFSGILQITYNSSSMILPTAASITTAAGDVAVAVYIGSGDWKVVIYSTASGQPLAAAAGTVPPLAINGLLPSSMTGSSTTASMTISAGSAVDSTAAVLIKLASSASWAVSNGDAANGYQGGTTLPSSSTVHMFLCQGTSGVTTFASTSENSPTCPTGYTSYFRRIFSFTTAASTTGPNAYTAVEVDGGGMRALLTSAVEDVNAGSASTARTLTTLSVPTGLAVEWIGHWSMTAPSASTAMIMTSPLEADIAPAASLGDAVGSAAVYQYGSGVWHPNQTNTSAQLYWRSTSNSATFTVYTSGWHDFRRS